MIFISLTRQMYSWHKDLMVSLGYFILLALYKDELKT